MTTLPKDILQVIFNAIRNHYKRSDAYKAALESALSKTVTGIRGGKRYECNHCNNLFSQKEVEVDHAPVTVVPFEILWYQLTIEDYYHRVYNLSTQVLCKQCHKEKTKSELKLRKEAKKKKS